MLDSLFSISDHRCLFRDGKFVINIYCAKWLPTLRAVDPDPHSFSFLDPDPGRKIFQIITEKCKEIGNSCKFIQFLKVNLHKLYCFLLLSNLLCVLQLKKLIIGLFLQIFQSWIRIRNQKNCRIRIRKKWLRIHSRPTPLCWSTLELLYSISCLSPIPRTFILALPGRKTILLLSEDITQHITFCVRVGSIKKIRLITKVHIKIIWTWLLIQVKKKIEIGAKLKKCKVASGRYYFSQR